MPLCRVRQANEVVQQRRTADIRVQAGMVEWHAKHVASVSAQTAEAGKAIGKWRLLPPEEVENLDPQTEADEIAKIVEEGSQTAADDPRNAVAFSWLEHTMDPSAS